jgi:hypothetical protein
VGDDSGRDADRQVDEEDPVPVQRLGQDAAGEQADGTSGGRDEAVHANRFGLFGRFAKHGHDHAEYPCRGQGTARALDEAREDQQGLAVRKAAEERGRGEHDQPGEKEPFAAEQIAQPSS